MRVTLAWFCAGALSIALGACTVTDQDPGPGPGGGDTGGDAQAPDGSTLPDGVSPGGQIKAISQTPAFMDCSDDDAAQNSGFSQVKVDVNIRSVVVVAPRFDLYNHPSNPAQSLDGYFLMDQEGGPFSGVLLSVPRGSIDALAVGDLVDVVGEAVTFWCNTQIRASAVTKVGTALPPAPAVVSASELNDPALGEAWEGALVRVLNAEVTQEANNFGEWTLGGVLRVDDVYPYDYEATKGDRLDVTGVMHYTFSRRKLLPRSDADIVPAGTHTGPDAGGPDTGGPDAGGPDTGDGGWTISAIQSAPESVDCTNPNGITTVQSDLLLRDVIVASPRFSVSATLDGYFVSDATGGPFSGVQVVISKEAATAFGVGDVVDVQGNWVEFYCLTQISASTMTLVSSGAPLPEADLVTAAQVGQPGPVAESYEGVVVRLEDVSVSDPDKGFGQFEIDGALLVDDVFSYQYQPALGDTFDLLRGPIGYSFSAYKLLPRGDGDIVLEGALPDPDAGGPDAGGPDAADGWTISGIQSAPASMNCANPNGITTVQQGLTLHDVVVTSPVFSVSATLEAYFVSDGIGGPFSGIQIVIPKAAQAGLAPGDVVDVVGNWVEFYCLTQISASEVTLVASGAPLPAPAVVTAATLGAGGQAAEPYEGVVVELENVVVTNPDAGFGQFQVDGSLLIDDVFPFTYQPALGDLLERLVGPVGYSFSAFKVLPRGDGDIVLAGTGPGPDATDPDVVQPDVTEPDTAEGWTIHAIQSSPQSLTCANPNAIVTVQQNITLTDVVVASPAFSVSSTLEAYFVTDGVGGPYSGLQLVVPKAANIGLVPGDVIDVVGNWVEFYCLTQLSASEITLVASGAPLPNPDVVTAAQIGTGGAVAESYEGVVIALQGVSVTNPDAGFGQFEVDEILLVDDVFPFTYQASLGDVFEHLVGPVTYSFSAYKVLPRGDADLVLSGAPPGPDVSEPDVSEPDVSELDIAEPDVTGPVDTIAAIQSAPQSVDCAGGASAVKIADVSLQGVIVASPKYSVSASLDGYFLTDAQGGPYSGVAVTVLKSAGTDFAVGDVLSLTGEWQEHFCMTQIRIAAATVTATGAALPSPPVLDAVTFEGAAAEPWEGVVVLLEDVEVVAGKNNFGVWQVADDGGEAWVGDVFQIPFTPEIGQRLESLRGVVWFGFGEYRLQPFGAGDVQLAGGEPTGPEPTSIAAIQMSPQSLQCPAPGNLTVGPVLLEDVVVVSPPGAASASLAGYHIMTPPNAPYSGVFMVVAPAVLGSPLQVGDVVTVSGDHKEYFCLTEVVAQSVELTGSVSVSLAPIAVTTAELAAGREDLEGSLVQVSGVSAQAANNQWGEFPIGDGVLVDDVYHGHVAVEGDAFASITGFLHYAFSAWRILPRDASDLVPLTP